MSPGSPRARAAVSAALLALCALAFAGAVRAYPGGSRRDPASEGFDPAANYWCDLMRAEAVNGADNRESERLARVAFLALAGSLAFLWPLAARLARPPWSRATAALGGVSCACLVAMAFLPYDGYPRLHTAATLSAGGIGLAAAGAFAVGAPRGRRRLLDAAVLAAGGLNAAVYSWSVLVAGTDSAALPVVQKAATLLLVPWVAVVLAQAARAGDG